MAVVYALLLAVVFYRSIKQQDLPQILLDTACMTTIVMLIIGTFMDMAPALLTLADLNEFYHDPELEALCLDWAKWLMDCIPRTYEGSFQHVKYLYDDHSRLFFHSPNTYKAQVRALREFQSETGLWHTVPNVSGGTGMGYDADHYKNILIAPMACGQSLTILALVEALIYLGKQ